MSIGVGMLTSGGGIERLCFADPSFSTAEDERIAARFVTFNWRSEKVDGKAEWCLTRIPLTER
ncbi:hypothetical protein SAY87_005101 [Trapa incisa]|uniref:Uncharacterized protein n=1 Tax=Trapa incisa TaxID=236973 RepID=A0AAN7JPU6_9MYRT|nr:hypothetical protein SAY87_005101 [Trapa incisa]